MARVGLTKPVVKGGSLEKRLPLDLQFQGVGPRPYPAVPTVPSGAAPEGMEFALTSLGGTQAQKAGGLAG